MMNIELNDSARRATRVPVAKGRHGRGYRVAVAWVIGAIVAVNAAVIV